MIYYTFKLIKRLLLTILLLWVGGYLVFLSFIPTQIEDPRTPTEAIIVLTGGQDRVKIGFLLLAENLAEKLFVSGVNPDRDLNALIKVMPEVSALPQDTQRKLIERTSLGYLARNTRGNADETTEWVRANGIKSIRLVTSAYHMPRSLYEMHARMPNILLIPHPVMVGGLGQEDWWQNLRILILTISEYTKYILAVARI